jgi:hypothetical protein
MINSKDYEFLELILNISVTILTIVSFIILSIFPKTLNVINFLYVNFVFLTVSVSLRTPVTKHFSRRHLGEYLNGFVMGIGAVTYAQSSTNFWLKVTQYTVITFFMHFFGV